MHSERFTLTRSEAARIFFGHTRSWLNRVESTPLVLPSGRLIDLPTNEAGHRVYTLQHIQDIAEALMIRGDIQPKRAAKIFMLVALTSDLWEEPYARL